MAEKIFQGVAASGGIGIGPVYLYHPQGFSAPRRNLRPEEVEAETARYRGALAKTKAQIAELETRMQEKLGDEHVAIFQAHQVVLEDPLFLEEIPEAISNRQAERRASGLRGPGKIQDPHRQPGRPLFPRKGRGHPGRGPPAAEEPYRQREGPAQETGPGSGGCGPRPGALGHRQYAPG